MEFSLVISLFMWCSCWNIRWSLMAHNVRQLGVCYFALQTFQALNKIYRQNNSTKPLLVAGAVN